MSSSPRAPVVLCAAIFTALTLTGCGSAAPEGAVAATLPESTAAPASTAAPTPGRSMPRSAATRSPRSPAVAGQALRLLGVLVVQGRGPKTGYSREQFGPAWSDTNRNGCDTRNDILGRDLTGAAFRPGTSNCVVLSGALADPYTGHRIAFTRADASAVQIDHVVALSDAWQKGAAHWQYGKRLAFGNDPLNLLAVDGPANSSKSDSDAASWLPANKSYRCAFVARQVAVKAKYAATVTPAERDALARVLSGCPRQPVPAAGSATAAPVVGSAPPSSVVRPTAQPKPTPIPRRGTSDPQFATCGEAIDAGYGPYARAESEYGWYHDGDRDGTVCER